MTLYHGGFVAVENPEIRTSGFFKDFGFGFYCTKKQSQAEKWATTKTRGHVVSVFEYAPTSGLAVKQFDKMTDEWLDFIVSCRTGTPHDFDIVEGPMADDTIWDFIESFCDGKIPRSAFWDIVKFRYPTHQIVFCTQTALQTIRFQRSYAV